MLKSHGAKTEFAYPVSSHEGISDASCKGFPATPARKAFVNERSKGALVNYLYMIVQVIVNLIYVPLLLGFIGRSEFGLYQLVGSVMAWLLIMNSTVSAAVQRYYTKYLALHEQEKAENVLGVSRILYRVLSLVAIAAGGVLIAIANVAYAESLTPAELSELSLMLVVLIANVIIVLNNSIYSSTVESHERFTFQYGIQVVLTALQPVAIVIAVLFYPYAISVVAVQLATVAIEALLRRYYVKRRLGVTVTLHEFDRKLARSLLVFSGSILLATIADQVFWRTDQLILGYFFGTDTVAVYGIAAQVFMCYMPLGIAVSAVFLPKVTRIYRGEESGETLSHLFIRIGRLSFFVLGAVLTGFIVFGDAFISLWAGDGYHDAYLVAVIIMVPFTIDLIQNVGLTILRVNNSYGFRARVYFATAVVNIIVTILIVPSTGVIGAAASTAGALFLGSGVVMNWYYWKRTGIDIPLFWRNICRIALAPFILFVASAALVVFVLPATSSWPILIIYLLVYSGAYLGVCWLFSFNEGEKDILRTLVQGMRRKLLKR